jgi:hypothetical protein
LVLRLQQSDEQAALLRTSARADRGPEAPPGCLPVHRRTKPGLTTWCAVRFGTSWPGVLA